MLSSSSLPGNTPSSLSCDAVVPHCAARHAHTPVIRRYQHAGIKRKPSIAAASSPASSATIKMFSLRSLRKSMASTSLALSRVAKDTPGLPALISTQTDITDILDPRIPYDGDSSSRRHLLSGNAEFSLAESNLRRPRSAATVSVSQLQSELNELNRRSDRRIGGSFAIKSASPPSTPPP